MDKFIITTNSAYTPTGFGPAEKHAKARRAANSDLTSPTAGKCRCGPTSYFRPPRGEHGTEITRVEFLANGTAVGEATNSPFPSPGRTCRKASMLSRP